MDLNSFNAAVQAYTDELNNDLDEAEWDDLYEKSVKNKIPIIRKTTAKLLYFLIKFKRPENFLEIGTGSGYSTLWIHKGLSGDAKLTTIERDKNRFIEAQKLFHDYRNIDLLYLDAFDYLKNSTGQFDFVFLDAQKRDYTEFLKILEDRVIPGGIFFTDNFLFNGKVIEMEDGNEEKYSGGVDLLKQFNYKLSRHKSFKSLFLNIDDGIIISIRK